MATDTQAPSRPPARPQPRSSRHALEPNPFEQSFSSKPGSSASPEADSRHREGAAGKGTSKSDEGTKKSKQQAKASSADSQASHLVDKGAEKGQQAGSEQESSTTKDGASDSNKDTDATPSKRLLPPVAAITSPSAEGSGSHYPWGGGIGSLRAGPLSPAMLTGPQGFDPSSFRTGFTPDLSNFKTGLTPLGNAGNNYPLPSPGTSAFMAMVNSSGPPITPNTFSALTSNLGADVPTSQAQKPNQNGQAASANGGDFDLIFGKQFGRQQVTSTAQGRDNKADHARPSQSVSPQMIQQQLAQSGPSKTSKEGQPQATQAASGLFLLSQAHQELSKRDEAAAAHAQHQAQQLPGVVPHSNGVLPGPLYSSGTMGGPSQIQGPAPSAAANKNNKRKKGANATANPQGEKATAAESAAKGAQTAGNGAGGTKPNKKARAPKKEDPEDELSGSDGESGMGDGDGDGSGLGGDDDEEKRKNFLERNRQAALKCRQRKKAWLQDLQAKVAFFESENGNLQNTIGALRSEVLYLKSHLMQIQQQLATKGVSMPPGMPGIPAPDNSMLPPGMHMPPGMHPGHGQHIGHPHHQGQNNSGPNVQPNFGPHGMQQSGQGDHGFSPASGPKAQAA